MTYLSSASGAARPRTSTLRYRLGRTDQGSLVLVLAAALVVFGAITTDGFLTSGNLGVILQLSAAFGVLAVGQGFVVLGKGVDLSVAAVALVVGQLTLELMSRGTPEVTATLVVVGVALGLGAVNGILVAFVGVPALIVTLGTGSFFLGATNVWLLESNLYSVPAGSWIAALGGGSLLGVPTSLLIAALVFLFAWATWGFTSFGRLLRSMGDNPDTARLTGEPVRPLQVASYVTASALAALTGYLMLAREGSVVTTGSAFSPLLFTALTIVVLGGVSLSGGRGTIAGVFAATLFVGVVNNLLTLHDFSPALQDFARGLVLIGAVALDSWLHPRDEETAKSEDM